MSPMIFDVRVDRWPMRRPFKISGYVFDAIDTVTATVGDGTWTGRGEACGVYYLNDNVVTMTAQLEGLRGIVEAGVTREDLQSLLPAGGARNALDCALWDFEAKRDGTPAWKQAALDPPRPLVSTYTCGAAAPIAMAELARDYRDAVAIKLKLTGDGSDEERVRAVRAARPEVWIGVDANQALNPTTLARLMPTLVDCAVSLIEQPFPVGEEILLDGTESPIAIAADESAQDRSDLAKLVGRFQVVNIKLDKCGGLTEGLAMARDARDLGLDVMVGNMMGTSLSMAPAFLVGQFATVVDLDGPILLATDRAEAVRYENGYISCPPDIWGTRPNR